MLLIDLIAGWNGSILFKGLFFPINFIDHLTSVDTMFRFFF